MRTVVDTGVLISALLLPRSVPRQALDRAMVGGRLLVSDATIAELDNVLRRPKFDRYVPEPRRLEFLGAPQGIVIWTTRRHKEIAEPVPVFIIPVSGC